MSHSYDKSVIRAFILLFTVTLCIILCSFVFAPLEMSTITNILYEDSLLPAVFSYLRKIFETVYIFLLFALVAFSNYFWSANRPRRNAFLVIAYILAFFRWILNFIATAIFSGVLDFDDEIEITLLYAALDIALIAVVDVTSRIACKKHYDRAASLRKAKRRISGIEYNERDEVFPFVSFISVKNPVLFPMFVGSIVYTAFLLFSRIYYDVFFGTPNDAREILSIVFGYAGDLLTGALCYILCYFSAIFLFADSENGN